jgi:hypothetical protein
MSLEYVYGFQLIALIGLIQLITGIKLNKANVCI